MRASKPSSVECRLGTVRVVACEVSIGDVVRSIALDALVSSDDSQLSMSGGVSEEVRRLAGPSMVREARLDIPHPVGTLITTSGGRLSVPYVFHAVTVDWENDVQPTERTIRQLAVQVFVRCEALGVARVAIPALASGAARFSAQRSASLIVDTLRKHARNKTGLRLVVFPLPHREAFEAFARELETPIIRVLEGTDKHTEALRSLEESVPLEAESESKGTRAAESAASRLPFWRGLFRRRFHKPTPVTTTEPPKPQSPAERLYSPAWTERRPVLSGRYVLLEEVGRGGMGVVYVAWDLVLRRVVAVKALEPTIFQSDRAMELLRHEAAIAMDLTHEGIVRLYHFEPSPEVIGPYIVMEYLSWPPGEKWIADAGTNGLPVEAIVEVGIQLCRALDYAHQRGVLHTDIKPNNVFVDPAGEKVKLADFGLARAMAQDSRHALVLRVAGTPGYMAPEQRSPGAKISPATDIYQLAATLWDFLTGEPLGATRRITRPIEAIRRRVLQVVQEGLADDPGSRPSSAGGFAKMLQTASGDA